MRRHTVLLAFFLPSLFVLPAAAANVYDNGPVNGAEDAWAINFGFAITDSFAVSSGNGNIGGLDFWAWLFVGDSIANIQVSIGDGPFGTQHFNNFVSLTQSSCFGNMYGYDVCMESGNFSGPNLGNGNYWLTLQNANVPSGEPAYWDENAGVNCQSPGCPSTAYNNSVGTLPSEAFTLTAAGTSTTTGSTPEPGSLWLLASGLLGVAAIGHRRFF